MRGSDSISHSYHDRRQGRAGQGGAGRGGAGRGGAGRGGAGRGRAGQGRAGMIKVVNVIAQVVFAYLPVLCVLSKLSVSVITAELWCG